MEVASTTYADIIKEVNLYGAGPIIFATSDFEDPTSSLMYFCSKELQEVKSATRTNGNIIFFIFFSRMMSKCFIEFPFSWF